MNNNPCRITKRQAEIAKLIMLGFTNKEIGRELSLSYRTIETHVDNIKMKLGSRNRAHMAAYLIATNRVSVTIEELEQFAWSGNRI